MAIGFGINYPKDRVGMYLVPLFMLLLIFAISNYKRLEWGFLLFLFFPLSLVVDFNLNTTLFSPKDRITEEMFDKVNELVPESAQLSAGWMAFSLYNYENRKHFDSRMIAYRNDLQQSSEYYLLTGYFELPVEYELLLEDEITKMKLYKQKKTIQKEKFERFYFKEIAFDGSNVVLFDLDSTSEWTNQAFSFSIKGKARFEKEPKSLKLHAAFVDENENYQVLQHLNMLHLYSTLKNFEFSFVSPTFKATQIKRVFLHIENETEINDHFEDVEIQLYRIK